VGDHLTCRVFNIRDTDGRSQLCASVQNSLHHNTFSGDVSGQNNRSASKEVSKDGRNQNTVRDDLRSWRDNFTFKDAMAELQDDNHDKEWTVAVLFSGGLLDTFASVRSGFTPIWGCETNRAQARMWEKFTNCTNLGDVFGPAVLKAERPMYIKSGAPCPNYGRSGNHEGANGETGWMFVEQANVIESLQPWCFCLEISEHALFVNEGEEVLRVRKQLGKDYVVKSKVIRLWQHGDPSNRQRLFMVGFHKELGQAAFEFEFPRGSFNDKRWPSARDISVSDEDVPSRYWRSDLVPPTGLNSDDFMPAKLHKIGSNGDAMGSPSLPNAVYSWDGLLNGQTTLNGGGRRPTLDWQEGEDIKYTRLVVPKETVSAASLPEDYIEFAKAFSGGDEDDFLRLCVNNGVPIRTGVALDTAIKKVLTRGVRRLDKPTQRYASFSSSQDIIRSMLFDSGANGSLSHRDLESHLFNSVKSAVNITVADGGSMKGCVDGNVNCMVVNTANQEGFLNETPFSFTTTTTSGLAMELLSFDEFYRDGWGVHLQPADVNGGVCELYRPARGGIPEAKVPLRYDWDGSGGFYLDYILKSGIQDAHKDFLAARFQDNLRSNSSCMKAEVKFFNDEEVRAMAGSIANGKSKDAVEIIIGQIENDYDIRGTKAGLRSKKSKLSELEFHKMHGHLGFCPDCDVCALSKGASRRIRVKKDPHRESRPGHTWSMDTVTVSHRSETGSKYLTVLRCEATNKFKLFCHYLKSDIRDMVEAWVEETRSDPAFHDYPYKMVSVIKLDNAGEWSLECAQWQAMIKEFGIECVYSCPDRKESNAHAEKSCGIVEVVIKSLLYEANLPPSWWEYAAKSAEFLLDRFPVTSTSVSVPMDGDRLRPLEAYTRGRYSRRQIDREISYFVGLGTPCLVQTTEKGSSLKPKTRWGICIGMYREQVCFMCPHTKSKFRSKSFAAFRLRNGLNYAQFLGLKNLVSSRASASISEDYNLEVDICLKEVQTCTPQVLEPILEVKATDEFEGAKPIVKSVDRNIDLGGSVSVHYDEVRKAQINIDPSAQYYCTQDAAVMDGSMDITEHGLLKAIAKASIPPVFHDQSLCTQKCFVDLHVPKTDVVSKFFDGLDIARCKTQAITSQKGDTFVKVCKMHKLRHDQFGLYKRWLIELLFVPEADLPVDGNCVFKSTFVFPHPGGSRWKQILQEGSRKRRRALHVDNDDGEDLLMSVELWLQQELQINKKSVRTGGKYAFNIREANKQVDYIHGMAARGKKKRTKAVATGKETAPANTQEALNGEHAEEWVKSLGNEFYGLCEMGVFDLGYTLQQLRDIGIHSKPVPLGEYYECKFGENGELSKRKARIPVQGHPGNMTKGIHYNETFSATPKESSGRILCALVALLNLSRISFDITKAYCWADLPPGELIALKYPSAFQEYHPDTGELLYIVMRKNLYGHPSAGRTFGKARDAALLKKFNEGHWSCERCLMDPCMFAIVKTLPNGQVQRAWMLAHVDDCDIAGENDALLQEILEVCKSIWTIEVVSSDFMLGIRRRITRGSDGKVATVKLDMIPFVEGMVEAFRTHLPTKEVKEPVPKGFTTSKMDVISDEEIKAVLDAGFQTGVGMVLWAARHVFPECRVGCSLVCRLMAKPSWSAFNGLMQIIKWMDQNKCVGLTYTAGVNTRPLWFVDASNKPDPSDGHCQYGDCCMWMGASVMEHSKKLKHVGLSSQHNEYMAMAFTNQCIVWMRQLFDNMGLHFLNDKPSVLLADNKPANILSKEDIVTSGNQYIYLPYHYNKEVQEMGFSEVAYVPTLKNISDLQTKAVDSGTIRRLVPCINGQDLRLIIELTTSFETRALNIRVQEANDHLSEYQHAYDFMQRYIREIKGR
jgi:hypothetical protein